MKKCLLCVICTLFWGCECRINNRIHETMELSGSNKIELEKVIKHYNGSPEKLKAALFLIENMYGHFSRDSNVTNELQPFYDEYVDISNKCDWHKTDNWKNKIDSIKNGYINELWSSKFLYDARVIKSEWLINEIDRSFTAWKQNKYTQNSSFDDFCKYILPYRYKDGVILDGSRDTFFVRHRLNFTADSIDFRDACDSLLFKYSFLTFHPFLSTSVPIYSAPTFEQVKRGTCEDKVWFNCLLLSSLGMAVTIDFTPDWGNRDGNHKWNSVVINGITYPFEPFWDSQRWKYKQTYNNETIDFYWGKFRLPKVYRYTYEPHFTELMLDRSISKTDIPPLFSSPFIDDVSKEYFKTSDVKVKITEKIPDNARYCYLCVFNSNRWIPVQYAKIGMSRNVVFKDMGMDIIYLPMFYQNATLIPAASPFYLNQNGLCEFIEREPETFDICINNCTSKLTPKEIIIRRSQLNRAQLIGYHNSLDMKGELLYTFTDNMDLWNNDIILEGNRKYRYIRLVSPNYQIALSEISFFEKPDHKKIISDIVTSSDIVSINPNETLDMIIDHLSVTGFHGIYSREEQKNKGILFDFGQPRLISSIHVIPYSNSRLLENKDYELFYWDKKWNSAGLKNANKGNVIFEDVPKGTIYKVSGHNVENRIFRYGNGLVKWF